MSANIIDNTIAAVVAKVNPANLPDPNTDIDEFIDQTEETTRSVMNVPDGFSKLSRKQKEEVKVRAQQKASGMSETAKRLMAPVPDEKPKNISASVLFQPQEIQNDYKGHILNTNLDQAKILDLPPDMDVTFQPEWSVCLDFIKQNQNTYPSEEFMEIATSKAHLDKYFCHAALYQKESGQIIGYLAGLVIPSELTAQRLAESRFMTLTLLIHRDHRHLGYCSVLLSRMQVYLPSMLNCRSGYGFTDRQSNQFIIIYCPYLRPLQTTFLLERGFQLYKALTPTACRLHYKINTRSPVNYLIQPASKKDTAVFQEIARDGDPKKKNNKNRKARYNVIYPRNSNDWIALIKLFNIQAVFDVKSQQIVAYFGYLTTNTVNDDKKSAANIINISWFYARWQTTMEEKINILNDMMRHFQESGDYKGRAVAGLKLHAAGDLLDKTLQDARAYPMHNRNYLMYWNTGLFGGPSIFNLPIV